MFIRLRPLADCVCCLVVLVAASSARATAIVSLELPVDPPVVGELFDVRIVADLPNPVLGWGLDFTIVENSIAELTNLDIAGSWVPAVAADGDGLAGVAFPNPVQGLGVVLATITLEALAEGTTDLLLSDDHPVDLTEGIVLDPSGFESVVYLPSSLLIVPEPTSLGLACILSIGVIVRRGVTTL